MARKSSRPKPPPKPSAKEELALGKQKFLFQRGVVGWGLPTFIIYMLLYTGLLTFTGRSVGEAFNELFPFNMAVAALVFALAGLFIGSFRWKKLQEEVQTKGKKAKAKNIPKSTKLKGGKS